MSNIGKEIVDAAEKYLAENPPKPTPGCECATLQQLYGMPTLCRACDEAMTAAAKASGWTYGCGV